MRHWIIWGGLCLCGFLTIGTLPKPLAAQETSQDERVQQIIQGLLGKGPRLQDFRADFLYKMTIPGQAPVMYQGEIFWSHGSYRINLPERSIIVDGQHAWIFFPEQKLAYHSPYERGYSPDVIQTLFIFLIAKSRRRYLGTAYDHDNLCDKIELTYIDRFFGYQQAFIWVNRAQNFVQRLVLVDKYEKTTEYQFRDIKFNQNLSSSLFQFDPSQYPSLEIRDGRE